MKYFRYVLCAVVTGVILGYATPVFAGDDGDVLKQSEELLKQAWNPGGDPPSDADRTDLLTKAIALAKSEPDHRLHRTRMEAVRLMQLAVDTIKAGDADHKVNGLLQDADRDLRNAIETAESH
jgi:hypothetical protein